MTIKRELRRNDLKQLIDKVKLLSPFELKDEFIKLGQALKAAGLVESGVDPALAIGQGGYALELPADVLAAERERIAKVLPDMDIVFLSALVPGRLAPILITEEMVKTMNRDSRVRKMEESFFFIG